MAAGLAGAVATAGVVVAVDQATKQLVVSHIARSDEVAVLPGLDLTNARNTGIAFGALQGGGLVVAILIGLALALLMGYFTLHRDMPWLWLPVGLLLGGALGNLADRARQGAVIEYNEQGVGAGGKGGEDSIGRGGGGGIEGGEVRGKRGGGGGVV